MVLLLTSLKKILLYSVPGSWKSHDGHGGDIHRWSVSTVETAIQITNQHEKPTLQPETAIVCR